jgi:hypothetical protein
MTNKKADCFVMTVPNHVADSLNDALSYPSQTRLLSSGHFLRCNTMLQLVCQESHGK